MPWKTSVNGFFYLEIVKETPTNQSIFNTQAACKNGNLLQKRSTMDVSLIIFQNFPRIKFPNDSGQLSNFSCSISSEEQHAKQNEQTLVFWQWSVNVLDVPFILNLLFKESLENTSYSRV